MDTLKSSISAALALITLLAIGAYAILGPTGLLAWSDYQQRLDQREAELASLQQERNGLRNRIDLLDPNGADPDLVGELMRKKLNVASPDEIIVPLK